MDRIVKVSVIVPVYNVEKYLDVCMESIINQTFKDIEIILVDDGSPDSCPQICDDYARKDSRIKVIHKKNAGLGYARNSGLEIASGEYVTFCDSDDYIDVDTYEKIIPLMDEYQLDEIRFTRSRFKDKGMHSKGNYEGKLKIFENKKDLKYLALTIFEDCINDNNKYAIGGSSCMAVYRREIIEKNKLRFLSEREYICEDYVFNFDYYLNAQRVGYLPHTFYHYRVNPESLTRTVRLDRIKMMKKVSMYISQRFIESGFSKKDTLYAVGIYVHTVRSALKSVFNSTLSLKEKRKWFMEETKDQYLQESFKNYPLYRLTIKQRLLSYVIKHRFFYISYALIVGFSKIRFDRFK